MQRRDAEEIHRGKAIWAKLGVGSRRFGASALHFAVHCQNAVALWNDLGRELSLSTCRFQRYNLLQMSTAEIIAELPRLSSGELAKVQAKITELIASPSSVSQVQPTTDHPALGMWKDRTDLPNDAVEASKVLRERMMQRTEKAAI